MVLSAVLGFPRIGAQRELKKATEAYWSGKQTAEELYAVGHTIRATNWKIQKDAGVDIIPSNDFSFYDQVLDTSILFNVIPDRYRKYNLAPIDLLFAMGRGLQRPATEGSQAVDVPACEMVKWFDSNYHYVRPTFAKNIEFKLNGSKPIDEFLEAKTQGVTTRPVLLGPVSFLYLGKPDKDNLQLDPIDLLDKLLPHYAELLTRLHQAGAETVQLDEPILVLDLPEKVQAAFKKAYGFLSQHSSTPKATLTTYFGDIRPNLKAITGLPVASIHADFVRVPEQLDAIVDALTPQQSLSVGIVSGRNVWKTDIVKAIDFVETAIKKVGSPDRVVVATSSSLLHTPVNLDSEKKLPAEIKDWFSFAVQKTTEVVLIAKAVTKGRDSVKAQLEANAKSIAARKTSNITNDPAVRQRQAKVAPEDSKRKSPFETRLAAQKKHLKIPLFPTTTIGSFPQTKDIRTTRNKFTKGEITAQEYEKFIEQEIQNIVKFQDKVGLDVYVHGEPERNDMVQYFGERLKGFVFTTNGWVQSYGSRYVRPPIIVGDISRPGPITVKESKYAQSLTDKPMKGMLTGPVTCLRWSFPRDDISSKDQAEQLALALRDEVNDLEAAGVYVIQVDEPAIREGLPLRAGKERDDYVKWAVESFRLATSGVQDSTQIHSHFCYSDLDPEHIKALDADVVSIEFSKKDDANYIKNFSHYPNHIGFGLFDIHSPRVPPKQEFVDRIAEILKVYPADKLWVNPDCGLKTRQWDETTAQLTNMVAAAKEFRAKYSK